MNCKMAWVITYISVINLDNCHCQADNKNEEFRPSIWQYGMVGTVVNWRAFALHSQDYSASEFKGNVAKSSDIFQENLETPIF